MSAGVVSGTVVWGVVVAVVITVVGVVVSPARFMAVVVVVEVVVEVEVPVVWRLSSINNLEGELAVASVPGAPVEVSVSVLLAEGSSVEVGSAVPVVVESSSRLLALGL